MANNRLCIKDKKNPQDPANRFVAVYTVITFLQHLGCRILKMQIIALLPFVYIYIYIFIYIIAIRSWCKDLALARYDWGLDHGWALLRRQVLATQRVLLLQFVVRLSLLEACSKRISTTSCQVTACVHHHTAKQVVLWTTQWVASMVRWCHVWIMWGGEAEERLSGPSLAQRQGISEPKGLNHANAPQDPCCCLPQLGGGYFKVEDLQKTSSYFSTNW